MNSDKKRRLAVFVLCVWIATVMSLINSFNTRKTLLNAEINREIHTHKNSSFAKLNDIADCDEAWMTLDSKYRILSGVTVVFIGDSRMRLLFLRFQELLQGSPTLALKTGTKPEPSERNLSFYSSTAGCTMRYYPSKYPDTQVQGTLEELSNGAQGAKAHLLVYETGSWPLYTSGSDGLNTFMSNLTKLAETSQHLPPNMKVVWMQTLPFHPSVRTSHNKWVMERRGIYRHIEQYGRAVSIIARQYNITLWSSAHDQALRHPQLYLDRIHANRDLNYQFCCQLLSALGQVTR